MYYLAIIQNESVCAIYAYENIDAALAAYHAELAYRAEGRTSTTCSILDNDGSVICRERWIRTEG